MEYESKKIKRVKLNKYVKIPSLFSDYLFNMSIQAINALIPILFIPIIIKKIGLEYVGITNYSQSFILYFTIFINYGFDFLGSRKIAQSKNDKEKSEILSVIITTKIYLFFVSFIVFCIILYFNSTIGGNYKLHIFSFLINIGFVMYPNWFFIGTGKYNYLLRVSFIVRLIVMTLLVSFLSVYNNYLLYTLSVSVIQIVIGFLTFNYLKTNLLISFKFKSLNECFNIIKESTPLFFSTAFINIYTSTTIFLLGLITNDFIEVGSFSVSYKLISGLNGIIITAFSQTVFSKISSKIRDNAFEGIEMINRLMFPTIIVSLFLSILVCFFSNSLASIFTNENIEESSTIIKVLSFTTILIMVSNQLALQGLINLKMDNIVLQNTILAGSFSIILNLIIIPIYGGIGSAYVIIATEFLVILLSLYHLRKIGYMISFTNTYLIKKYYNEIFKK